MKHYLTRAQMRELAEIGIDTRALATHECTENGITYFSLSIGDLIGMLPREIGGRDNLFASLTISPDSDRWNIYYANPLWFLESAPEIIDALYKMVIRIKQERI